MTNPKDEKTQGEADGNNTADESLHPEHTESIEKDSEADILQTVDRQRQEILAALTKSVSTEEVEPLPEASKPVEEPEKADFSKHVQLNIADVENEKQNEKITGQLILRESIKDEEEGKEIIIPEIVENDENNDDSEIIDVEMPMAEENFSRQETAPTAASSSEHENHVPPSAQTTEDRDLPISDDHPVFYRWMRQPALRDRAIAGAGAGAIGAGTLSYVAPTLRSAFYTGGTFLQTSLTYGLPLSALAYNSFDYIWGLKNRGNNRKEFINVMSEYFPNATDREKEFIKNAVGKVKGYARKVNDKDLMMDKNKSIAEQKKLLCLLQDAGAVNALNVPALGTDTHYSMYCYSQFMQTCKNARENPNNRPANVKPEEWEYLASFADDQAPSAEKIEKQERLLKIASAYGRSITDLKRQKADAVTIPAGIISTVPVWYLGGGLTAPALMAGYGLTRWVYRRYMDRKSNDFEIGPDGKINVKKDWAESVSVGLNKSYEMAKGAVKGAREVKKNLSLSESDHHDEHISEEDIKHLEEEIENLKDERNVQMAYLRYDRTPTTGANVERMQNEIRRKQRELADKKKKFSKQKKEKEKLEGKISHKIKKTVKELASAGVSGSTGSVIAGAATGGLSYFLMSLATSSSSLISTSGIVGGLAGIYYGWKGGVGIYKKIKSANKKSSSDSHH